MFNFFDLKPKLKITKDYEIVKNNKTSMVIAN